MSLHTQSDGMPPGTLSITLPTPGLKVQMFIKELRPQMKGYKIELFHLKKIKLNFYNLKDLS